MIKRRLKDLLLCSDRLGLRLSHVLQMQISLGNFSAIHLRKISI
jgi:hypothetical protein